MPRTPTEAEVRASIRAERDRRNAMVDPAERSRLIRERERGYGAAGSPYAETAEQKRKRLEAEEAAKRAQGTPASRREVRRAGGTAQEMADKATGVSPRR